MSKKWMPITAGILEILAGFGMLGAAYPIFLLLYWEVERPWEDPSLGLWTAWMIPFVAGLLGILSVVGGVFALKHRRWGLAFAGAIATFPLFVVAGLGVGRFVKYLYGITWGWLPTGCLLLLVIAIITLIVLSKREFK